VKYNVFTTSKKEESLCWISAVVLYGAVFEVYQVYQFIAKWCSDAFKSWQNL